MNYFELFNLPIAPTVDKSVISKTYFELQKKYHPDFYSYAGESEKEEVLQRSADVNNAYKTFQNPENTIEYFLRTTGLLETDEKYNLPPEFLMEMMDINETFAVDEITATKQVEEYKEKLGKEVEPIIQNYHSGNTDGADLQKIKIFYFKKKYLKRILDRIDD